jgi:sporulation protein YlmC with PRC-barrel domain
MHRTGASTNIIKDTSVTGRKAFQIFVLIVAFGSLALKGPAAEAPNDEEFRDMEAGVSYWGMTVKGSQDITLGRIHEIAIDVENGRIVEMIVASDGTPGMGETTFAVPPKSLTYDPKAKVLRLEVDGLAFNRAPRFEMSRCEEHCRSSRVAEVYRLYGQEPYFAVDTKPVGPGDTAIEPPCFIQPCNKLFLMTVRNLQGRQLGSVTTFLYSLKRGSISHVIVVAPGQIERRSVIPSTALRFAPTHDELVLDVSWEAFTSEPRFKWNYDAKGEYKPETHINTMLAASAGANTRQNVREGGANTHPPLAQGDSHADMDGTARIHAAMRADASLSQNAQCVEVCTLNGRVTLRGHVTSEDGKCLIGEIAATALHPENVNNLLEVRPLAVTP